MNFRKLIILIFLPLFFLTSTPSFAQVGKDGAAKIKGFDIFAKKVSEASSREVVKKFENLQDGFMILMGVMTLMAIAKIIITTGLESSASMNEAIKLVIALVLVSSCYSTNAYSRSGLQWLFIPSSGTTGYLDSDVVFWFKDKADDVAHDFWGKDIRAEFENERVETMALLLGTEAKKKPDKEQGFFSKLLDSALYIASLTEGVILELINTILEYVYTGILLTAVTIFAIQAGLAILFFKFIAFMGILPDYRDKVWSAFKVPASTSLYNFVNIGIIALTTIAYKAVRAAGLEVGVDIKIMSVAMGVFAEIAIVIQILCIIYIPKTARALLNGSIEEIVGFAEIFMKTAGQALSFTAQAATAAASGVGALASLGKGASDNKKEGKAAGSGVASALTGGRGNDSYPDPKSKSGPGEGISANIGSKLESSPNPSEKSSEVSAGVAKPTNGTSLKKNKTEAKVPNGPDEQGVYTIGDETEAPGDLPLSDPSQKNNKNQGSLAANSAGDSASNAASSPAEKKSALRGMKDMAASAASSVVGSAKSAAKSTGGAIKNAASAAKSAAINKAEYAKDQLVDTGKYLTSKGFVKAVATTAGKTLYAGVKAFAKGAISGSIEQGLNSFTSDVNSIAKHNYEKGSVDKDDSVFDYFKPSSSKLKKATPEKEQISDSTDVLYDSETGSSAIVKDKIDSKGKKIKSETIRSSPMTKEQKEKFEQREKKEQESFESDFVFDEKENRFISKEEKTKKDPS